MIKNVVTFLQGKEFTKDKSLVILGRQRTADDEEVLRNRSQQLELKNQPIKVTVLDSE